MPRLLSRRHDRSSRTSTARPPASLPAYQSPSYPLNEAGRVALGELCRNRDPTPYDAQLKQSLRLLGHSVGDLHERLRTQQDRLDHLRRRRLERESEKLAEEERLEAYIESFDRDVDEVIRASEEALRHVIDQRAEREDEAAVLMDLYEAVQSEHAAHARHRADSNGEAEDDAGDHKNRKEVPPSSTLDALRTLRAAKHDEYIKLDVQQRYARHNDYIAFKKLWHDSAAGEEGPPLPDATRWFRSNGEPVMDRPGGSRPHEIAAAKREEDGEDEEDEIAVAREVLSLKCPLTLRPMEKPFSNHKCKHTFEKSAMREYISQQAEVRCPQTGCNQVFQRSQFSEDFFLDEALLRRIERAKQSQRNAQIAGALDDDSDDDG